MEHEPKTLAEHGERMTKLMNLVREHGLSPVHHCIHAAATSTAELLRDTRDVESRLALLTSCYFDLGRAYHAANALVPAAPRLHSYIITIEQALTAARGALVAELYEHIASIEVSHG
jgi:hypothetical protein